MRNTTDGKHIFKGGRHITIKMDYTLSGRTGSVLVWHTRGRALEPRLLKQVMRFVGRVNILKYVELRGYNP